MCNCLLDCTKAKLFKVSEVQITFLVTAFLKAISPQGAFSIVVLELMTTLYELHQQMDNLIMKKRKIR